MRDLWIWTGLNFMSEQHFERNTSWDRVSSTAVPVGLNSNTQFFVEEGLLSQAYHCGFSGESMIATKHGLVPVSELSVETPILTRDHGYQPLASLLRCPDRPADTGFKTVLIRKGALGCDLPTEDIYMPAEQLLLVLDKPATTSFCEYLVRAEDLIQDRAGMRYHTSQGSIFAVLFEEHEIIQANGIWTSSSFRPPDTHTAILTAAQKALLAINEPKPVVISRPVMTGTRAKHRFSRANRALGIYGSN